MVNRFQPPGRSQLYALAKRAWNEGMIISSGNIHPETFVSEMDQLAAHHHVPIEIKRLGGKAYCLANEGCPLGLDPESDMGQLYKQVNPHYRITMSAWTRIREGLGLE